MEFYKQLKKELDSGLSPEFLATKYGIPVENINLLNK